MAAVALLFILGFLPAALSMYGPLEHKIGLSDAAKFYILCQHNKLRAQLATGTLTGWKSQPKAANMQCLCWSEELVPKAQKHASDCSGPPHDARSGRGTDNFPDVGQNLMNTLRSSPIDESLEAFLEEINGYSYDTNSCDPEKAGRAKVCGHYTALMWASSQAVGCAYDVCDGKTNGRLVCNYGPGGNQVGQKPYVAGEPCTQCASGQSCLSGGLCCSCGNGECGGTVSTASSNAAACVDKHAQCEQFRDQLNVCQPSSAYYTFAQGNCKKACNFCGGGDTGKFCTKSFNVSAEHCSVHSSTNAAECVTGNGLFYVGTKSTTVSGKTCMAWATDDARTNYYHSFEFPERNKANAKNYCRNPASSGTKPWCYTTDPNVRWEYCDIPAC